MLSVVQRLFRPARSGRRTPRQNVLEPRPVTTCAQHSSILVRLIQDRRNNINELFLNPRRSPVVNRPATDRSRSRRPPTVPTAGTTVRAIAVVDGERPGVAGVSGPACRIWRARCSSPPTNGVRRRRPEALAITGQARHRHAVASPFRRCPKRRDRSNTFYLLDVRTTA